MTWDPSQYERFKDERSRPFHDLLDMVRPKKGMRVVDLGCGTGALTRAMHERLGAKDTLGLDSSEEMLARAAGEETHGLRFERGDIGAFAPAEGAFDLVFSNAALHWLPDHAQLLTRLAGALAARGQLAVQVPANHRHPSHTAAAAVARQEPFASALGGFVHAANVLPPVEYARVLDRLGFREQRVRLEVYVHRLPSRDGVVEWTKGTLLTDYKKRLPPDLFERFVDHYRERLHQELDDERPFFFPFERILFWGER
jgi:trans-aconitate 2-methyltransferase